MTQLQKKALEHVDELLIHALNDANSMDEPKEDHNMAMRSNQLAKDINEIQMWCRAISSDPQESQK